MRVVKEPEERKKEILDAAEKFFAARGYEAATIIDILDIVNKNVYPYTRRDIWLRLI